MDKPLVSVVIPAYNADYLLPDTINSVFKQTYENWEALIVDDGSTDNTLSIAKDFAAKDPRVKVFSLGYHSGGPAAPRNLGIRHARGSYIAFLDSDDLWLPEKLQKQVDFLEANLDVFLLHSQCIIERDGKQLRVLPQKPKIGYIFTDLFVNSNTINCLTVIMRNRKEANKYLFDEDSRLVAVEDYAMWLEIAYKERVSFINEPLAIYRINSRGISSGAFSNFKKSGLVIKKFSRFVPAPILLEAYFKFYATLIFVGIIIILSAIKKKVMNKSDLSINEPKK